MDPQHTPATTATAAGSINGDATRLAPTMDASECAQLLRCSKATVEVLADRGELPATKIGRGWVFVTEQILGYLQTRCETEAAERRAQREPVTDASPSRLQPTLYTARPRGRPRRAPPLLPVP